jgi:allantoinase
MRGVQAARERLPNKASQISLSLHCETAEIMTAYTRIVEGEKKLDGLAAYHASRPPAFGGAGGVHCRLSRRARLR